MEKNTPKKTKKLNQTTKKINNSLLIYLPPHNVGGDKHCYQHENWAVSDMSRAGWLAVGEGQPILNCQTSSIMS